MNIIQLIEEYMPKEERAQFGRETSWEIEHANGFNACRSESIAAVHKIFERVREEMNNAIEYLGRDTEDEEDLKRIVNDILSILK